MPNDTVAFFSVHRGDAAVVDVILTISVSWIVGWTKSSQTSVVIKSADIYRFWSVELLFTCRIDWVVVAIRPLVRSDHEHTAG